MKALMLLCSLVTVIPAAQWQAKVVGVKNANALEILRDGKVYDVKLYGVDCLAKTENLGKAARRFSYQAFMTDVNVEIISTESNGSLVAKVTLADGKNLSAELIKNGLAWWDKRSTPEEKAFAAIEKDARAAFMGIWADYDDDGNDRGKEILAKRELADKGAEVLTANN
jgi:micrococcal nuclease